MTIAFRTQRLEKQLTDDEARLKNFGMRAKKISLRLDEIGDARNLAVLLKIPHLQCKQLTHNPGGEWSVNVVSNYWMLFLLDHSPLPIGIDNMVNAEEITSILITGFLTY